MTTKLTTDERNMIANALGLQVASFKRSITAAQAAKDSEIIAYREKQYNQCLALISRVNNFELF